MLDLSKLDAKEKEEALALLKKLGVDMDKSQPTKKTKKVIPVLTSYTNCYENRCQTCKHIQFEYYLMAQPEDSDFLRGIPIKKEDVNMSLKLETHVKKLNTCSECYKRLEKLTKEDLIKMLIKEKLRWI
jgi:hypothetical protein